MKKFLKIFIIVVLVIASIALAVFLFYKNHKKKLSAEVSFVEMIYSQEKQTFDEDLAGVALVVNTNGTDNRFYKIISTSKQLDNCLTSLTSYYAEQEFKIEDEDIRSSYNSYISTRNLISNMIKEYNIKSTSSWFNKKIGANDMFNASSRFLVKYAEFVQIVNSKLDDKGIDKSSDLKFYMIDVYARIVKDTFSNLQMSEQVSNTVSEVNLNFISKYFNIENSYITGAKVYSESALDFIENYNMVDKDAFAKNLSTNVSAVISIGEESTSLQKATYYYKQIYGIGG